MGEHVRIEADGRITIDAAAWIAQRTSGVRRCLTGDLHQWAREHADRIATEESSTTNGSPPDWPAIAQAWCDARGHRISEPNLIRHTETRLDTDLWLLLATTADDDQLAVVGAATWRPSDQPRPR